MMDKVLEFLNTHLSDIYYESVDQNGDIKEYLSSNLYCIPNIKLSSKELHQLDVLICALNKDNFNGFFTMVDCKLHFEILLFECDIKYQNGFEYINIETAENSISITMERIEFEDIRLPLEYKILICILLYYFRSNYF